MKKTALDEKLGPLDLGPDVEWTHYGPRSTMLAFCGEQCDTVTGSSLDAVANERICPDCARRFPGRAR